MGQSAHPNASLPLSMSTPEQYVQQKAAASGSSFYYAFLFLPAPRRAAITAFYAFCREVDDVVDEVSDPGVARCIHGVQCPCPPTQGASGFHHRDVVACLRQRHGCRHAGPAGPHHRDAHHMRPRACTFHASQNLRKGVRRMRWCSTWKLSCSISRSRVR